MREQDSLDLLIDSAAATYGEPPTGLEGRVLQALAAEREAGTAMRQPAPSRRRWLPWAIALPVAACALVALLIQLSKPHREAQVAVQSSAQLQARPARTPVLTPMKQAASTSHPPSTVARRSVSPASAQAAQMAALPKLNVFPSPQPLTPQEQALVAFVIQSPETERKAVAEAQQQIETPISIAAIHIPPLESPDKGQ